MFKYSGIYLKHHVFFTLVYLVLFSGIIYILNKTNFAKFPFISRKFFVYISVTIILVAIFWITFLPRFGQVGRYQAIVDWLDGFYSGRFPYNSHITPSGFPFLFIISIPFYLIGNAGYLEVLGLILFLAVVIYYSGSPKESLFKISALLLCPVFYYGFVVRDELFFNIMLPVILIFLSDKYMDTSKINFKFVLFGLLFGMALSTRSIVAVIYAAYLLYLFKSNILNGIIFIIIISITFGLTLLPFYLWDPHSFINYGPLVVQSHRSHMPGWIIISSIVLAFYAGRRAADLQDVLFSSGILLFLLALIPMSFKISEAGFDNAVMKNVFDLSYFVFCIPFLILALKENKSIVN